VPSHHRDRCSLRANTRQRAPFGIPRVEALDGRRCDAQVARAGFNSRTVLTFGAVDAGAHHLAHVGVLTQGSETGKMCALNTSSSSTVLRGWHARPLAKEALSHVPERVWTEERADRLGTEMRDEVLNGWIEGCLTEWRVVCCVWA
jgi:hypothetical protein